MPHTNTSRLRTLVSAILALPLALSAWAGDVEAYVTTGNQSDLMTPITNLNLTPSASGSNTITLNADKTFQQMEGFGAALNGTACYNLLRLSAADRSKLLNEVFNPLTGMGQSYVRISIGCSDFSLDDYTYCDQPGLENFAIHPLDKRDLLPVLKEVLAINPSIRILASPWTAPRWMKVNNLTDKQPLNSWTAGRLNPDHYTTYADYFVKFIQTMQTEGITIHAITIQNEPLNPGNSASMYMTWEEQRDFVRSALGPQFRQAGIQTKILVYDHNYNYDNIADQQRYVNNIYADTEASRYIYGSAWHAYGGQVSELDNVIRPHADKAVYFTEMSIGSWNYTFPGDLMWCTRQCFIETINRNASAVILWNFMVDADNGPYRPGGCSTCYGMFQYKNNTFTLPDIERKSHYYSIHHFSKVVRPGAFRIQTSGYTANGVAHSAFVNPDNSYALVIVNDNPSPKTITVAADGRSFTYSVPARGLASFRWPSTLQRTRVELSYVDFTRGSNTLGTDADRNIILEGDDRLYPYIQKQTNDWWIPMYNDNKGGCFVETASSFIWKQTLWLDNKATYSWRPYTKAAGWRPCNETIYPYAPNQNGFLTFSIDASGNTTGQTLLQQGNLPSTITTTKNSLPTISREGNRLRVESPTVVLHYTLYAIDGTLLSNGNPHSPRFSIALPRSTTSILLLRLDEQQYKVAP